MDKRQEDLNKVKSYTNDIDKDLTMILQTLQWDRKHILEHAHMTTCIYNANHKVISTKLEEHQQKCFLQHNGYAKNDQLLPDPVDINVSTLIKLDKETIKIIIDNAAKSDPTFQRGCDPLEPLSLGRLQCAYTPDERRAIHDAVVSAAPSCHDLTDLALPSTNDSDETPKPKSRTEILAELRDMRRRRTKYRVAAKSRNYSDVLRDVIKTQMEHYNGAVGDVKPDLDQADSNNKEIKTDFIHYFNNDSGRNEAGRQFSRRSGRYSNMEHKEKERSDRDTRVESDGRRMQYERTDRRNEEYRDRRHNSRDNRDHTYRQRSRTVKGEVIRKDDAHRDRSKDNSEDNDHEKHKYREKYESKHKKSDRESRNIRSREYDDRNRDQRDGSKYYDRHSRMSDSDRARNLITDIKIDIDASGPTENNDSRHKLTSPGSSAEIKREKFLTDRMSSRGSSYRYGDKDKINKYDHGDADYSLIEKYLDINLKNRRHEYSGCRERDERKSYSRIEVDNRDGSRRDRSRQVDRKPMRTEDKHKIYSEIYSEMYNKRNKLNEDYDFLFFLMVLEIYQ